MVDKNLEETIIGVKRLGDRLTIIEQVLKKNIIHISPVPMHPK